MGYKQSVSPSKLSFVGGPPGMGPMNPRMNPPRGPGMGPMGPGSYGPGMRGPPPGPGMPPMGMQGGRPQWQPSTSTPMSYSSSSPGNYGVSSDFFLLKFPSLDRSFDQYRFSFLLT